MSRPLCTHSLNFYVFEVLVFLKNSKNMSNSMQYFPAILKPRERSSTHKAQKISDEMDGRDGDVCPKPVSLTFRREIVEGTKPNQLLVDRLGAA